MTKIDEIDRRILHALQQDGRISNAALADAIGLSASACLRRVQELERSGVIAGYRAVLEPATRGIGFIAYMAVGLNDHSPASLERFEGAMARTAEVTECHNVTGTIEYLLRVEVADLVAYKAFHTTVLGTLPQISAVTTYVVMDSPKDMRK